MPSPRKGGTTPVRRRRKTVPRTKPSLQPPIPPAAPWAYRDRKPSSVSSGDSSDSWTDTSDTSMDTSGDSPRSARSTGSSASTMTSSSSSSSASSSSSSDDSCATDCADNADDGDGDNDDDDDDDSDEGGGPRSGGEASAELRGRSWSRRGARQRGGSVLCRFCGNREYGVMEMASSCCSRARIAAHEQELKRIPHRSASASSSPSRCPFAGPAPVVGKDLPRPPPTPTLPSPRYNWSPCSTGSSSSSSTLSDTAEGFSSSGGDADV